MWLRGERTFWFIHRGRFGSWYFIWMKFEILNHEHAWKNISNLMFVRFDNSATSSKFKHKTHILHSASFQHGDKASQEDDPDFPMETRWSIAVVSIARITLHVLVLLHQIGAIFIATNRKPAQFTASRVDLAAVSCCRMCLRLNFYVHWCLGWTHFG